MLEQIHGFFKGPVEAFEIGETIANEQGMECTLSAVRPEENLVQLRITTQDAIYKSDYPIGSIHSFHFCALSRSWKCSTFSSEIDLFVDRDGSKCLVGPYARWTQNEM